MLSQPAILRFKIPQSQEFSEDTSYTSKRHFLWSLQLSPLQLHKSGSAKSFALAGQIEYPIVMLSPGVVGSYTIAMLLIPFSFGRCFVIMIENFSTFLVDSWLSSMT